MVEHRIEAPGTVVRFHGSALCYTYSMRNMTPQELGWVAGILEGEGCFTPSRQRSGDKTYVYARIQLNMTDEDVMIRFHETVGIGRLSGPHYYKNPNWKPRWTWRVSNGDAKDLMREIRPLMGARRGGAIDASL